MEPLRPGDPDRVGGYECIGRLGAGGMGQVFLARSDDGALVALKVVHADLADDPAFRARFARETAAMRRVSGSSIAPLLDTGDVPRPWLAMAYLPGLSLDAAVARHGPLGAPATRRLGAALAGALAAIHRAGVVHRDLKPANVLLTPGGPRLVDFGVADGPHPGTTDGTAGTPAYMAPEQLTGGAVTGAADVFALGGVLAFCRTGEPPFGTPPPPPGDVPRDRDDEAVHAVIAACLNSDPARRPAVAEVAAALSDEAVDGGALPARMAGDIAARAAAPSASTGTRPPAPRYGRRRVLLQLSGAGAAALTGVGTVRAAVGAAPPAAPVLWTARGTMVNGDEFGPVRDGGLYLLDRTVVTRSGGARLELCRLDGASGRRRWRLPLVPFERGRGAVAAALGTVWVRDSKELVAVDPGAGGVRWTLRREFAGAVPATAFGDALVYDIAAGDSDDADTLYAHDPGTGRVVWRHPVDGRLAGPVAVAGNVLYLVVVSEPSREERVRALDCATGAVRWTSPPAEDGAWSESGHPGATLRVVGGTVYVSAGGRLLRALDAGTGRVHWLVRPRSVRDDASPEPPTTVTGPAIVGKTLLLGTDDGTLRAFDARDGRERWAATGAVSPGSFRRSAAPLAGHGLVFVRGFDTVRALRVRDGRVRWEHPTDPSSGEPVLTGGALHVPGRWEVTSHDPTDGRVVQRFDLHRRRGPTTVLAGRDALYVLAGPDIVIALGLP